MLITINRCNKSVPHKFALKGIRELAVTVAASRDMERI